MEYINQYELTEYAVKKSPALISAKYKMTALAIDIANVATTRIQKEYLNGKQRLVARLYPSDINKYVKKGKNIYRELELAATSMVGQVMLIESKNGFTVFSMIPRATYDKNILEIEFAEELRPHLLNLEDKGANKSYTTENIVITSMLKKSFTKRLYQILSSYSYRIKSDSEEFHIIKNISELRFSLGIANINEKKVQDAIAKCKTNDDIDWDYLYSITIEKNYTDWDKFNTQVLKVAQADFLENADIVFDFYPVREGRKYRQIEFVIRNNTSISRSNWEEVLRCRSEYIEEGKSEDYRQITMFENLYPKLYSYLGKNGLSEIDLEILLDDARRNEAFAIEAIEAAIKSHRTKNFMGYCRNYIEKNIKGEWEKPVETLDGSAEKAASFNEFCESAQIRSDEDYAAILYRHQQSKAFAEFMKENGLEFETFNILPAKARLQMFTNWRILNKKGLDYEGE